MIFFPTLVIAFAAEVAIILAVLLVRDALFVGAGTSGVVAVVVVVAISSVGASVGSGVGVVMSVVGVFPGLSTVQFVTYP